MRRRISVDDYFKFPESNRPMELVYGYVREPAMPAFGHEAVLIRLIGLLDSHVRERQIGKICRADVVLDREAALVVQPDLFFISNERMGMVDDRVWGAPDLVIEIASPGTQRRDRTLKLAWYKQYGTKEYWLVYQRGQRIEVVTCQTNERRTFHGDELIVSRVLPGLAVPARGCFS
jgi:Uma2 family endonuclease